MDLKIDHPAAIELSREMLVVLGRMFVGYRRINITKEFKAGLSGSHVLEIRPVQANGTPELPTIVKIGSTSLIQEEWRAYQRHIHNCLPQIMAIAKRPTLVSMVGLAGLRYPMMGSGDQDIVSLREFCQQPDVTTDQLLQVFDSLLRAMDHVWGFHQSMLDHPIQSSYGLVLPPDLMIRRTVTSDIDAAIQVHGRHPPSSVALGSQVALTQFRVHKVDIVRNTITLRSPPWRSGAAPFWVRVSIPEADAMPDFRARQIVNMPPGEVIETRQSRLNAEVSKLFPEHAPDAATVALAEGIVLPNPLANLAAMLQWSQHVNISTIHGDFNLENVLIAPQHNTIGLIDFANARRDHVLHDLIHLESEVMIHILPEIIQRHQLDPLQVLVALSWQLHRALSDSGLEQALPIHPALRKPWVMLRAIRRAARRYLYDRNSYGEYYLGLSLYLLGALRYRHLEHAPQHPLAKKIAFWAATIMYQWQVGPDQQSTLRLLAPLLERASYLWPTGAYEQHGSASIGVARASEAANTFAELPTEYLPTGGVLPAHSRMPLERNRRFVGRQEQLKLAAATLKQSTPRLRSAVVGCVVVGLGGVGKTQLVSEFAYRYGRFFSGGVFWLSCAEPAAFTAEIATCGEYGMLGEAFDSRDLALEERVRRVLAEWALPIPRLLIFDNCETPALLMDLLPPDSGCRVLITSRRADWRATLGLPMIELDVLQRTESLELLREHQPDAEAATLAEIASELGDLPLALHLAGSYLARYRATTNPADYLAQIREASPLSHASLQSDSLLPTEHDSHVARTFALSYDRLDPREPAGQLARILLHGAACLAPGEPIPIGLATLALVPDHEPVAGARGGLLLKYALDYLIELGLIREEVNHALWVHRLVVAFMRERLGARLTEVQEQVERVLRIEAERLNTRRDPAQLRGWQVHLRAVAEVSLPRADASAADICHALAEHLYQSGDYAGARAFHERALAVRQRVYGSESPKTAHSLTQIGKVMLFYGDTALAEPYFTQALQIQLAAFGDHNETATTLNHLGFLLGQQARYDEAQRYHEQALRMRQTLLGSDHPAVVDSLCNLAFVEFGQKHFDASQAYLEQALAIQRRATGDSHPETARVLTNLGELYLARNDPVAAKAVLLQALEIQSRELGAHHPESARILGDLGDVQRLLNDGPQAKAYYDSALEIFRTSHGPDHPRTRAVEEGLQAISASSPAS